MVGRLGPCMLDALLDDSAVLANDFAVSPHTVHTDFSYVSTAPLEHTIER